MSEGLADHFNFQPPASGAAVSTNVAGPEDDGCSMFHKECMDNLVHILEQTGARIVLSSTWRKRQEWHQGKLRCLCNLRVRVLHVYGQRANAAALHRYRLCKSLYICKGHDNVARARGNESH